MKIMSLFKGRDVNTSDCIRIASSSGVRNNRKLGRKNEPRSSKCRNKGIGCKLVFKKEVMHLF